MAIAKRQRTQAQAIASLAQEAGVEGDATDAEGAPVLPRRGRRAATAAAPTTKPMEQMLWDAACSIRGEKDAAKFKDYLLPLLFLKRLSDVFDDEIARLAEVSVLLVSRNTNDSTNRNTKIVMDGLGLLWT